MRDEIKLATGITAVFKLDVAIKSLAVVRTDGEFNVSAIFKPRLMLQNLKSS